MTNSTQKAQSRTKKPSLKAQLAEANAKLELARELWRMIPKGQARKIVLAHRALSQANKAKSEALSAQREVDALQHERDAQVDASIQNKFVFEPETIRELQHTPDAA